LTTFRKDAVVTGNKDTEMLSLHQIKYPNKSSEMALNDTHLKYWNTDRSDISARHTVWQQPPDQVFA